MPHRGCLNLTEEGTLIMSGFRYVDPRIVTKRLNRRAPDTQRGMGISSPNICPLSFHSDQDNDLQDFWNFWNFGND